MECLWNTYRKSALHYLAYIYNFSVILIPIYQNMHGSLLNYKNEYCFALFGRAAWHVILIARYAKYEKQHR